MSLWQGVVLCVVGLMALHVSLMRRATYYTPVFLSLFFLFGYVLSLTDILLHYDDYASNPWFGIAVSNFAWSGDDGWGLLVIVVIGMAGMMLATFLGNVLFKLDFHGRPVASLPYGISLQMLVILWAITAISLQISMEWLGIGRTGLINRIELPFALNGTLIYVGSLAVPTVALFLLQMAVLQKRSKVVALIMLLAAVEGAIASFVGTSRGLFVMHVAPLLFYLMVHPQVEPKIRAMAKGYGIGGFLLLLVIIQVVDAIREVGYAVGYLELSSLPSIIRHGVWSWDLSTALATFFNLITGRIGGLLEMMAVYLSPVHNWELFYGTLTGHSTLDINRILLNLTFPEDRSFGVGFGLFGSLFLSGSVLVVFVGSFLFVLLGIGIENVTRRLGFESISCGFSLIVAMHIWDYWYWSRMWKELLVFFVVLFVLVHVARERSRTDRYQHVSSVGVSR